MALSGQDLVFKFCNFLRIFQNLEFGTERLKHRLSVMYIVWRGPLLWSPDSAGKQANPAENGVRGRRALAGVFRNIGCERG